QGTGPRETADALRRLRGGGLVEEVDGGLRASGEPFKDAARAAAAAERPAEAPAGGPPDAVLRTYVRDGRLLALPTKFSRRQVVLRHVARHGFTPGERYAEPAVNDILRRWCADAETDHVALRRYLVEAGLLDRRDGWYWLRTDSSDAAVSGS
ncbi:DUF2087 domain-containing protein, partial [Streptomyces oceani]|uniref:DUF2087 domain-containing protein n=1 Tax=Streptomyces oceani TaxID=1075402 RepID=UPI0008720F1A